jgi:hypothetical protein
MSVRRTTDATSSGIAKAIRVLAVVGVFAASAYVGSSASADHTIAFTDCADATPGVPEPTLTPPPVDGEPTPAPDPGATPPPQNCVPSEGERIWGTRTLEFTVDENSSDVDKVSLSILSQEENVPSANEGNPLTTWAGAGETPFSFDWNSFEATPYNGIYKLVVSAHARPRTLQRAHDHKAERVNLRVDNAPRPVDPPTILATTLGSVTLEWPRAVEPDVTAYTIYRATTESASIRPAYADFKQVGITTGPAFRDSSVGAGVHWYSVWVTRRSVITPDVGISSPASAMSGPAEVQAPNATPKPGSKGGGDDGDDDEPRFIPFRRPQTVRPQPVARGLPDAPFAYKLPYDTPEGKADFGAIEQGSAEGPADPRGAVLPVAVGMFLVSSALAVGRMPY